jgi:hypothetical protein
LLASSRAPRWQTSGCQQVFGVGGLWEGTLGVLTISAAVLTVAADGDVVNVDKRGRTVAENDVPAILGLVLPHLNSFGMPSNWPHSR